VGPKPKLSAGQRALAAAHGGRDLQLAAPEAQPEPSLSEVAAHLLGRGGWSLSPSAPTPVPTTAARPKPPAVHHPLPAISAYGDSVILGARLALQRVFPGGTMDAVEGRQADPILADIDRAAAAGRLNPLVIIHVGDNGLIDPGALRHTLSGLRHVQQVIVVNDRVGRAWQNPNNRTIASIVPRYHNASLLDWHRRSSHHGSWFFDDGIHLTASGALAYARLLADTVRR
jgi:lysophospholipase L1-like esterase